MTLAPLFIYTTAITSSGSLTPLGFEDLRKVRLAIDEPAGLLPSGKPSLIRFRRRALILNETRHELASVSVRFVFRERGRRTFVSKSIRLTNFSNLGVPWTGGLLPYNFTKGLPTPAFDAPAAAWRSDTFQYLEIVGAETFQSPDLHNLGHFYAALETTPGYEVFAPLVHDPSLLRLHSKDRLTTCLAVFGAGNIKTIRYVLAHGGNPKDRTSDGTTIMHMAALNGEPAVLQLAQSLGGKVNVPTNEGVTPLLKAILIGQVGAWRWLLAHGANPKEDGLAGTPAQCAINAGRPNALADLVRAGVRATSRDRRGNGWLDYCIAHPYAFNDVARYGIPIDGRNPSTGETALMEAARSGREDSSVWLLKAGANPELRNRKGQSCYDLAKSSNTLHTDRFFRDLVSRFHRNN